MKKKLISLMIATFLLLVIIITTIRIGYAVTWSTDTRLTTDLSNDWDPAITQTSDGKIWVTWYSERTGNEDIFYKISSDNGVSWSSDIQLTFDPSLDMHPSILQTKDGKIWVVWDSNRTGDYELYYKTSINNGASWSEDTRLTTDSSRDSFPSIMQTSDGNVWVFWTSGRTPTPIPTDKTYQPGQADIYYKVSSDGGQTWSPDTRLVTDYKNNYRDDLHPSAMQAQNGSIWVVWDKEAKDIYYKIYNGTGWLWEVQLTTDPRIDTVPSIMQTANGRIWVFWDSDRNIYNDLYYKVFDGSWSNDIQLTTALEDDLWPSAMQAKDLTIWVVWCSPRYPQLVYGIFYRSGMELHDVGVRNVTPYTSHKNNTLAYRGEIVYFAVEVENQGEGKETFEVKCYANSTQVGSKTVTLGSGKTYVLAFNWNTARIKPGMYVTNAIAEPVLGETHLEDNSMICGPIEVRIWGDIVGVYNGVIQPIPDRHVDIDDFGIPIGHFGCVGPAWPHPTWDPFADVNEDLVVDLDDIMIVGVHYGET